MDKIWDKRFVPVLLDMLENQAEWMPRKNVAEVLGRRNVKESLPYLEVCAEKDRDSSVRGACREAYWKISSKIPSKLHPDDIRNFERTLRNPIVEEYYSKKSPDDPNRIQFEQMKKAVNDAKQRQK